MTALPHLSQAELSVWKGGVEGDHNPNSIKGPGAGPAWTSLERIQDPLVNTQFGTNTE